MQQIAAQQHKHSSHSKPILIHLPTDLISQLNDVSSEMGIARAELIRRCLIRDLSFVIDVELEQLEGLKRQSSIQYERRMRGARV